MELRLIVMALVCLCIAQLAFAVEDNYPFTTPQQEHRFIDLIKEVRCIECKNQTLYDSNASVALNMRAQIYRMLKAGATDESIRTYLISKYGEHILFNPPWRVGTLLLWLSPLILLTLAMLFVSRLFKYTRFSV